MNAETIVATLRWGMELLPFPWLLLYVIALSLLWLFAESVVTRIGRATPGWRQPVPVLPWISEAAAWLTRGSSWLLWTWAALYLLLVGVQWLSQQGGGASLAGANDALLGIARTWQQAYTAVVGILPPLLVQMLPGV